MVPLNWGQNRYRSLSPDLARLQGCCILPKFLDLKGSENIVLHSLQNKRFTKIPNVFSSNLRLDIYIYIYKFIFCLYNMQNNSNNQKLPFKKISRSQCLSRLIKPLGFNLGIFLWESGGVTESICKEDKPSGNFFLPNTEIRESPKSLRKFS